MFEKEEDVRRMMVRRGRGGQKVKDYCGGHGVGGIDRLGGGGGAGAVVMAVIMEK